MAVTDSIADALTIMRNGSFAKKAIVEIKASRIIREVLTILKDEKFIKNFKMIDDKKQGTVRIYLSYSKNGVPALTGIKRISKPGLRVYKKIDELPRVYAGLGIAIISTSKGLLTDRDAREKGVGGEVLCYAW